MNFNFGNLVSAAVGAVSKVANAVANVCEDGEIDEDEIEEILANVVKVYVGATMAMFGSEGSDSSGEENSNHNGGPTLEEAAAMAAHIYYVTNDEKNAPLPNGWKYDDDPYEKGSMRMGVYKREVDGETEYALVNRGSRPIPGYWDTDWKNNAQQPFGYSDDMRYSLEDAQKFVDEHPGANITFIGHSKGGRSSWKCSRNKEKRYSV